MEKVAAAIGFDIGTSKAVIAAVKQGGVEIILNESAGRSAPTVVAYGEGERLVGDSALNQIKSNFKNTVQFVSRFPGLKPGSPQLANEKQFVQNTITETADKIQFEVRHRGEVNKINPEQLYATVLQRLRHYYNKVNIVTKDVVISVPSYLTASERQAVLDAAKIVDLNVLRLINESTAIALNYGLFRKNEFANAERKVIFVDFGHGKLTVTIASFVGIKVKILAHHSDRNLGARNFDMLLMEHFSKDFMKKYGCDPSKVPKCRLRMLDAIEKLRKILSANQDAQINVESLLEDEDLNAVISRAEFEKMIEPSLEKVNDVLQKALFLSKISPEQVHSVELVGEATRIPIFQECIKNFFGVQQLSRTLNSAECIARGSAIQSAMLSPLFKVTDFEIEDWNPYSISVGWSLTQPDAQGNLIKHKTLFNQGSNFPSLKSLTFEKRKEPMDVEIRYADPTQLDLQNPQLLIGCFKIEAPHPKEEKFDMVIKVRLDLNGLCYVHHAELNEEYFEEKQIPVKKMPQETNTQPKPAAGDEKKDESAKPMEDVTENAKAPETVQEYETKIVKKTRKSELKLTGDLFGLSRNELTAFVNAEQKWSADDLKIVETKEYKNELEGYVYDMRANIDSIGTFKPYIQENIRLDFLKNLNAVEDWLYGDGKDTTKDIYLAKLQELRQIGDPMKKRYNVYTELPHLVSQFMQSLDNVKAFLVDLLNKPEEAQKYKTEKISELKNVHENAQKWLDEILAKQQNKAMYDDPAIDIPTFNNTMTEFMNKANELAVAAKDESMNKDDKKNVNTEAKKDDDVEMKENPKTN